MSRDVGERQGAGPEGNFVLIRGAYLRGPISPASFIMRRDVGGGQGVGPEGDFVLVRGPVAVVFSGGDDEVPGVAVGGAGVAGRVEVVMVVIVSRLGDDLVVGSLAASVVLER